MNFFLYPARPVRRAFWGGLCALSLLVAPAASAGHAAAPLVQTQPTVVINEVLAHADDPYVDAVELFNPGDATIDLSGWLMTDDDTRPQSEWVSLPAGATLYAGGFYVIENREGAWSFGLSEAGDNVFLFRPNPLGGAPIQVAAMRFGASPRNVSFIRYVDSTGKARFPMQAGEPSLGAANCGVLISAVQIEELMIDPPSGDSEYVVVANVGSVPAPLFDPDYPTNTWKLIGQKSTGKDADMFVMPQAVTLAPGERIILSETSPDLFRQEQNIPASVRIFGPLESGLSSSGERIALGMPLEPELDAKVNYALVDEVEYSNQPPWPSVAENGKALRRVNSAAFGNDVANWYAAPALQSVRSVALVIHRGARHFNAEDLYLPFASRRYCEVY